MAGFVFPPRKVHWYTRDVLLFANSIGATYDELQYLYENHPDFHVFPTYPSVLGYKGDARDVLDAFYLEDVTAKIPGAPKLDVNTAIDAQRAIRIHKPPPVKSEDRLELRKKVLGFYDKGQSGTIYETETSLVDKITGEVFTTEVSDVFFVGEGNWGGPKGPKQVIYAPPKDKKPDRILMTKTNNETALLFRLNGEYNVIHVEPERGLKLGLGGVILHGLYTWNVICHRLLRAYGSSKGHHLREFQARCAKPVFPGDVLITHTWRTGNKEDGFDEIVFFTKTGTGSTVLSNGRALIKVEEERGNDAKL